LAQAVGDTKDHVIISGHRRCQAAIELGRETVPVEVREFENELAELEALLLENASRFKTTEQKVREALMWRSLEESKAKF
jgi:ParB family chromosome partitioning protein